MTCNFLQASDKEMLWVLRASVIVVAAVATVMALTVKVHLHPLRSLLRFPATSSSSRSSSAWSTSRRPTPTARLSPSSSDSFSGWAGANPPWISLPSSTIPTTNVVDGQLFPFRTLGAIIAFPLPPRRLLRNQLRLREGDPGQEVGRVQVRGQHRWKERRHGRRSRSRGRDKRRRYRIRYRQRREWRWLGPQTGKWSRLDH